MPLHVNVATPQCKRVLAFWSVPEKLSVAFYYTWNLTQVLKIDVMQVCNFETAVGNIVLLLWRDKLKIESSLYTSSMKWLLNATNLAVFMVLTTFLAHPLISAFVWWEVRGSVWVYTVVYWPVPAGDFLTLKSPPNMWYPPRTLHPGRHVQILPEVHRQC